MHVCVSFRRYIENFKGLQNHLLTYNFNQNQKQKTIPSQVPCLSDRQLHQGIRPQTPTGQTSQLGPSQPNLTHRIADGQRRRCRTNASSYAQQTQFRISGCQERHHIAIISCQQQTAPLLLRQLRELFRQRGEPQRTLDANAWSVDRPECQLVEAQQNGSAVRT